MATGTYVVVKGDTLSGIASKYVDTTSELSTLQKKIDYLVKLNNIANPNYIVVGQVIKLDGTASTVSENKTSVPKIQVFGLQSNSERVIYATWTFSKPNTDHYQVIWYYDTGDGVWFIGDKPTTEDKQSTYTAPSNAKRVRFKVKAVATTRTVNGIEQERWQGSWSTLKTYTFGTDALEAPSAPSIELNNLKLTVSLNNVNVNASRVQFQIVKNNNAVVKTGSANSVTQYASYSCTVAAGAQYKARCRLYGKSKWSDWSEYTDNVRTAPSAVTTITTIEAKSDTSIYLKWDKVNVATTYEIEYTTKEEYFATGLTTDAVTSIAGIESTEYLKTGLESGEQYFFRIRAVNDDGNSPWSEVKSVTIGKKPEAPTTWSSTTTVSIGEPLNLYWVHNTVDGSSQTQARLTLLIDGVKSEYIIDNSTNDDEKDKTSCVSVDTTNATLNWTIDGVAKSLNIIGVENFTEGGKIQWYVETRGVTNQLSDPSIERTVDIYAPPVLEMHLKQYLTDSDEDNAEVITQYPFYVTAIAEPKTQAPTSYHVTITANESYETVDSIGNVKMVSAGDEVYSKYFDTDDVSLMEFSASSTDLENNISYTITGRVSMNSGLTAESSLEFTVSWTDMEYEPNAELMLDEDTLAMHIRPYCEDTLEDITLAVYRREYDGTFVEIASGIANGGNTYVTDPHPALDYARYRIVATYGATGQVIYYDMPGYPIGEHAAIIQWDENWRSFETDSEDELEQPAWSGSMLKIPYNIDVSDRTKIDVALVEYVGRQHPISYYGTHQGATSTWNMSIPKSDTETIYALRRLAIWKGDVYVREPSGTGYWANISVSFSLKHCEVTIPVTFEITRVEGGV